MDAQFKPGDEVVLTEPGRWVQPYRGWGEKKRRAVVEIVDGPRPLPIKVRFRSARPPKWPQNYVMWVTAKDIVLASPALAPADGGDHD
jgi:hypothetical protein